jgi:hypothetical protein
LYRHYILLSSFQAEHYDLGGEGAAYHDTEMENLGGAYRPDEGVDLQRAGDVSGGWNVGWIRLGEWLKVAGELLACETLLVVTVSSIASA